MGLKIEIERELQIPVRVRAGAPGSLDVYAGDERIYSKKKSGGGSPNAAELIGAIRQKLGLSHS